MKYLVEHSLYGNSYKAWLVSIIIILCAFLFVKLLILFNTKVITKVTAKTKTKIDDIIFGLINGPLALGIMLFAIWVAAQRLELPEHVDKAISAAYKVLVVLNATWLIARIAKTMVDEYLKPLAEDESHKIIDAQLLLLIRRSATFVIWAFGVVWALSAIGVNVATLVAGLGIGGVAFALAAQDTIKNIFGGFTIFTDHPFRIGDRIKVDGIDGFVEDIGVRSTRLRTLDRRLVTIPNYKVVDAAIENVTDEPARRVILKLGLVYSTTPNEMREAMTILKQIPYDINDIKKTDHTVAFTDYGESSLNLLVVYYIRKSADIFDAQTKVNLYILEKFNEKGLSFAFPTRTVYVEK